MVVVRQERKNVRGRKDKITQFQNQIQPIRSSVSISVISRFKMKKIATKLILGPL